MGLYISPGKHGSIQRNKYFERGKPCPVIVSVGQDPVLFMVSGNEIDYGVSEFDYATGGLKGAPIEVIEGPSTGLPFAANAEIVIEGWMDPTDRKTEGPFGEWTGYYASSSRPEPVIRVENVYYRNDPILCCARPGRPPSDYSIAKCMVKASFIWEQVEKAGVPDVRGVWCHEAGGGRLLNIISIKQRYPGHARQAMLVASQVHAGAYLGRYVIVLAELTRAAVRANVAIYTIDPRGLTASPDLDQPVDMVAYQRHVSKTQDTLRVLADETGGRAIVNRNDFDKDLDLIDADTSDYHMLGYYSTNTDPSRRRRTIEIEVRRPGVDVRHRTEYSLKPVR